MDRQTEGQHETSIPPFQLRLINMTVVTEQTTEACDWKLIGFIGLEVEFIETSLIAYPWYAMTYLQMAWQCKDPADQQAW